MPSREAVPVEVVGRPSIGDGRMPGGGRRAAGVGGVDEMLSACGESTFERVSATLRLRNAMNGVSSGGDRDKL